MADEYVPTPEEVEELRGILTLASDDFIETTLEIVAALDVELGDVEDESPRDTLHRLAGENPMRVAQAAAALMVVDTAIDVVMEVYDLDNLLFSVVSDVLDRIGL